MATKKECDRCKKQWNPEDTTRSYGNRPDSELCTFSFHVPYDSSTRNGTEVVGTKDLCQACARCILKELDPKSIAVED